MSLIEGLEPMDLEQPNPPHDPEGCSICFDPVLDLGKRSIAKLQCGHEFHLDCIGSAFNAKGMMQCPNCRKIEKGQWLYANVHRSATEFDLDSWATDDIYDLSYSELPFTFQWCPIRGLTQLASLFEEGEPHSNSLYGEQHHSSSSHICPYLALHGFPRAVHTTASAATDSVHRHPASSMGGQISGDNMLNSQNFSSATEPQLSHNWQQQPSTISFPVSADHSTSHLASRLHRSDSVSQQRLGSFVHPHAFLHEPVTRTGSNLIATLGRPVVGGHSHGSHAYHQSAPSASLRAPQFALVRRTTPRGLALFPPTAASSSADIGGFYGYPLSGSISRNHLEGDGAGRSADRFYGWGREVGGGSAPLPWIPTEAADSQWWGPFQNVSADPAAGNFFHQRNGERFNQSRPDGGYHRQPPHM